MCGINLIVSTKQEDLGLALNRMQDQTAYRGPDSSNILLHTWNETSLALGSSRLRIIDNDPISDQPMASKCGNYLLAYNGEVYNYQDLKSILISEGQEFISHSDTEVVLYWLKSRGVSGLSDFKGMFALAFVNLENEEVIFGRDRHGIKPLYIFHNEGDLIISSSLKSIAKSELVDLKINDSVVNEYLAYRHVLGTKTFYHKISAAEPGVSYVYNKAGLTTSNYEHLTNVKTESNLKESLIDALTLTTSSGGSPALLLSGGVDSTLLLALHHNELGYSGLPTFTLNTGEDIKWARKAALQYRSDHHEVEITRGDFERAVEFLDIMDQPIADHGAIATLLISEKISHHSKVILSGAGADELFGGYNRHRAFDYYLRNKAFLLKLKSIVGVTGDWMLPNNLKSLVNNCERSTNQTFYNFLIIHGIKTNDQNTAIQFEGNSPDGMTREALDFDKRNYLVNDVLSITDQTTMFHGIEARVPYLYDDVLQVAGNYSAGELMELKGKGPLKKLLNEYDGKTYSKRNKLGFGLPMANWLRRKDSNWLWEFLEKESPVYQYVKKSEIEEMLKEHQSGKRDWNMQLWSILVLQRWLNQNVG